ncbi:MAG: hypothetical protein H0X26_09805 [Alphaproteobacteria bacterium]|nr:hypothetical protein [Alphaproteobacteria bacterium]
MLHEPLSMADLNQIANARFLEVEDNHLVWVGSSDQSVLNKIDDLRLNINWILTKQNLNSPTFRTRLETSTSHHQPSIGGETQEVSPTGLNHHSKGDINHV